MKHFQVEQTVFTAFKVSIKNQMSSLDGPCIAWSNYRVFANIANNIVIL